METGGSGDDVHGLKFGKKIYFEQDAAARGSGASSGSGGRKGRGAMPAGSSGGAASSAATGAVAGAAAATPPRCQVEGCGVDLSGTKTYYCRHKVCSMHSKAPRVVVAGIEQRFCQQCSRFHQLPEFDQDKRSCRRRLAGHNERRRKPPPGPLGSRYGRAAASFQEPGRFRSFLMDFSYPRVSSSAADAWPGIHPGDRMSPGAIQWQGNHELRPHGSAVAGYIGPAAGGSVAAGGLMPHHAFELPPGGCVAGVSTDSSCALSLLSTQPWDSSTQSAGHHHLSPAAMSTVSAFEGTPVSPSVMAGSYTAASAAWSGSRVHHGGARIPQHHHSQQEDDLHLVHPGAVHHGHFSGELELALQGSGPPNPPHVDQHGSSSSRSSFGHSSNAANWSL